MNKPQYYTFWSIVIIAIVLLVANLFLSFFPFLIFTWLVYNYFKWQENKIKSYEYNWLNFFKSELQRKFIIAILVFPIIFGVAQCSYSEYEKIQALEKERFNKLRGQEAAEKEAMRIVLQARQDSFEIYFEKAENFLEKRKYRSSLKYLDSALYIFPEDTETHYLKATVLKKRRKYKDAIEEYKWVVEKGLYNSEGYLAIGNCLIRLNKKQEALSYWSKAAKLGNNSA